MPLDFMARLAALVPPPRCERLVQVTGDRVVIAALDDTVVPHTQK